jgi:hypothetical protein
MSEALHTGLTRGPVAYGSRKSPSIRQRSRLFGPDSGGRRSTLRSSYCTREVKLSEMWATTSACRVSNAWL